MALKVKVLARHLRRLEELAFLLGVAVSHEGVGADDMAVVLLDGSAAKTVVETLRSIVGDVVVLEEHKEDGEEEGAVDAERAHSLPTEAEED